MDQSASTLRLRLLLEVAGVTPGEVAKAAGVSKSAVSYWLSGDRRPTPARQRAIARIVVERALEVAFPSAGTAASTPGPEIT